MFASTTGIGYFKQFTRFKPISAPTDSIKCSQELPFLSYDTSATHFIFKNTDQKIAKLFHT